MTDPPFPRNPYVIGVPLTGDVGFFGRRGVLTFVQDTLESEHQNVIVLYGQRRVGKTSLLHQLAGQLAGDVLPVYFDLQGKEQQTLGPVLYSLARTVARPLELSAPEQTQFDNAGRFFREEFLPAVYEQLDGRRLLLLFDEFDVLGDELATAQAASETLFPYLQDLIMHERQLAFVFVVGRRIEELATHFQAIFKQAAYRRVGLLQPEDARSLIIEPAKDVLSFEEDAIGAILDLTAGHPYFTQLLCSETFNAVKTLNLRTVTEGDILELVDRAIESGHGALTWFWDGLPRAERFILSAVAHVTDEAGLASKEAIRRILEKHRIVLTGLELTDAPDRLVEWEMLRREGPDHYRFVVELVRRWIIKAHPLDSARRDVDYISQRAVRLYENAREAHTAGDLEYALEEYRRALDANPNHSGAQLGLAQVLFELGKNEEAIEEFSKAYVLDEMSARDGLVRARLAQGKKLEKVGQQNEAVLQYEQALSISPTDETTRQRLASVWLARGRAVQASKGLEAAFVPFEKALSYDSGETTVREVKFKFDECMKRAVEGGDYEEALKAVHQLQRLLPEDTVLLNIETALWTRRGDALAKAGEGAEAIRAYQQALALKPGSAALTKKLEAISAEWQKLLEIDRIFNKAMVARQDKDWVTAQSGWQRLIKMDVLSYKEHNIAALLSEAIETINNSKREQQALFERALIAHQAQDWPAAESAWQQLLEHGIETYDRRKIRSWLAEAKEGHLQQEKRGRKMREAPAAQSKPEQRETGAGRQYRRAIIRGCIAALIVGVIIVIACATALSSCNVAPPPATEEPAPAEEEEAAPAEEEAAFRAGLVTDVGKVNDGTFNQYAFEGMMQAVDEYGLDSAFIETQQPTDYDKNVEQLIDEGFDQIVTVGFMMGETTQKQAEANPDVNFCIVDFAYDPVIPNVMGLVFREDQAGFLAGALAGLMTETGTVGTVAGIDIPPVKKFRNGYENGVKYVCPECNTIGVYIDSFTDPARGKAAAESQMAEGADVIFGAGGPTGSGGILGAAQQGVWVIGVDQDEYFTTFKGGEEAGADKLLSSAMKRVDVAVYTCIKEDVEGTFEGQTAMFDASVNGVGLAPFHDTEDAIPDEVKAQLDEIFGMLADGSLDTGVDPVSGDLLGAAAPTETPMAEVDIGTEENPIQVLFVPSVDAGVIVSGGEVMAAALEEATGLKYKVSVPTSYAATVEAMCASPEDTIGFIPALGYVIANQKCGVEVGAAAVRFGWPVYWAQYLVPRDSDIQSLEDLAGKKWAIPDLGSTSGYLYPSVALQDAGIQVGEIVEAGGHPQAALAVYNGEVDFATTYFSPPLTDPKWQPADDPEPYDPMEVTLNEEGRTFAGDVRVLDARTAVMETAPDIFQKVRILELTDPIPNDTMSFSPDFPDELKGQILDALVEFTASEACLESICSDQFYNWTGLDPIEDTAYDPVRKLINILGYTEEDIFGG